MIDSFNIWILFFFQFWQNFKNCSLKLFQSFWVVFLFYFSGSNYMSAWYSLPAFYSLIIFILILLIYLFILFFKILYIYHFKWPLLNFYSNLFLFGYFIFYSLILKWFSIFFLMSSLSLRNYTDLFLFFFISVLRFKIFDSSSFPLILTQFLKLLIISEGLRCSFPPCSWFQWMDFYLLKRMPFLLFFLPKIGCLSETAAWSFIFQLCSLVLVLGISKA